MRLMTLASWFKRATFDPPFVVTTKLDHSGRVFYVRMESTEEKTIRFRFFDTPTGVHVFKKIGDHKFEEQMLEKNVSEIIDFLESDLKVVHLEKDNEVQSLIPA